MSQIKYRVMTLATLIALLTSCEKVDLPAEGGAKTDTTKMDIQVRNILLEDYTGHQCGNCPAAALVAENLTKQYKGRVITIAVHAGFFARTNSKYPMSYTTTVGNEWDGSTGFNVSAVGNPNGMVNRKNYDGGGVIQKESKWPSSVSAALNDPYILSLDIQPEYNSTSRNLNTTVKARFKNSYPNSVNLAVILTEDSIIGPQTDYTKNPDLIPNYVFMHMLRDGITGAWGVALKTGSIAAGDSVKLSFPNFNVKTKFVEKHLAIVAFAFDATTREVLQVVKKELYP